MAEWTEWGWIERRRRERDRAMAREMYRHRELERLRELRELRELLPPEFFNKPPATGSGGCCPDNTCSQYPPAEPYLTTLTEHGPSSEEAAGIPSVSIASGTTFLVVTSGVDSEETFGTPTVSNGPSGGSGATRTQAASRTGFISPGSSNFSFVLDTFTTAGNFLVFGVHLDPLITLTVGSLPAGWHIAESVTDPDGGTGYIIYSENIAGGQGSVPNFPCVNSGTGTPNIGFTASFAEFSGPLPSGSLDKVAHNSGITGGTIDSGTTATTTETNELAFAYFRGQGFGLSEYEILATVQAANIQPGGTSPGTWLGLIATFKTQ